MTAPLVRARRRVRVVAPAPLAVAVAALGCELTCVVVALGAGPGSPGWLPGAAFAGAVVFAGLAIGTLRRAVSGRPRTARHHGTVTPSGTRRVAPLNILGAFVVLVALVVFGGCTAALLAPTGGDPLPQVAAGAAEKATEAAAEEAEASTCDVVREALLTGTKVEIREAMKALVADKTADADARESARDYLNRTDPDLKESAASLVQLGCS